MVKGERFSFSRNTYVFLIVALLVGSFVGYGIAYSGYTGKAISNKVLIAQKVVKATSCDADKVCETNSLNTKSITTKTPDNWGMNLIKQNNFGVEVGDKNTNGIGFFSNGEEVAHVQVLGETPTLSVGKESNKKSLIDVNGDVILSSEGRYLGETKDGWEMNLIRQNDFHIEVGDGNTNGINFYSGGEGKEVARISEDGGIPQMRVMGSAFIDEQLTAGGDTNINGKATLWNLVELPKLIGSGNAYACLNSKGQLFRSETPCK